MDSRLQAKAAVNAAYPACLERLKKDSPGARYLLFHPPLALTSLILSLVFYINGK